MDFGYGLLKRGVLPGVSVLLLPESCPFDHGAFDARGKSPCCDGSRVDVNFGVEVTIFDVEMWRWMLAEADPDDGAVEPTEFRHRWRLLDLVE